METRDLKYRNFRVFGSIFFHIKQKLLKNQKINLCYLRAMAFCQKVPKFKGTFRVLEVILWRVCLNAILLYIETGSLIRNFCFAKNHSLTNYNRQDSFGILCFILNRNNFVSVYQNHFIPHFDSWNFRYLDQGEARWFYIWQHLSILYRPVLWFWYRDCKFKFSAFITFALLILKPNIQ